MCRYATYSELETALEEHGDAINRAMSYCKQDKDTGADFFDNFLKMILEKSFMYRLYPAGATGVT